MLYYSTMRFLRIVLIFVLFTPFLVHAQESGQAVSQGETFEARVVEIIETRVKTREDGSSYTQQDLRVRGVEGAWKNREVISRGISEIETVDAGVYKKGDHVLVYAEKRPDGSESFTVVDYIRRPYIYLLFALFVATILFVGRLKGLRALLALVITFLIIMGFIIPRILSGTNPILISILGAIVIAGFSTYLTEGLNRKAHMAVISIALSLAAVMGLSILFTALTRLTGLAQEGVLYLISLSRGALNFEGLMLAGILIGTLGVLDDAVLSQIETVSQIREANPYLSKLKMFKMAFKVGNSHLGAIVNTLFLTYAGASLPVLLLFKIQQGIEIEYTQVLNSEVVALEIIRTLVGSIGIALSLPIATTLAIISEHPKSLRAS